MTMPSTPRAGLRCPLSLKLLGAYAAVVLCAFAAMALPLNFGLRRDYVARATTAFEEALSLRIRDIREAAENGNRDALDLACDSLNTGFGGRVTILGGDGAILADSMSAICIERARPECLVEIRERRDSALRRYQPLDDTVSIRMPVVLGSLGPATIRLALPIEPVRRQTESMHRRMVVTAVAALVVAGLVALTVSRRLARPIEELTRAAERIAAGDFEGRLPTGSNDEIGRLAGAFASMQRGLRATLRDLRRERNQAQAIVNNMSDGVVALSPAGAVLYANRAAQEMLHLRGDSETMRLEPPPVLAQAMSEALEHGRPGTVELGTAAADSRVTRVTVTPLSEIEDGRRGVVLVCTDMTEARRVESMGRELVANASHELRTPLAILASTADTLLALPDAAPPEQRQEFLQIIARQSERMRLLVAETLQLSELEAGRSSAPLEPLDAADIVRQAGAALEPLARRQKVRLLVPDDLPEAPVSGSETALVRAVMNLVDNALRYSPPGSTARVGMRRNGSEVQIEVEDDGPGIAPAEQKRVFERFVRGRAADQTKAEGSGLGLAIVRRIADLHGGRVELESAPGKGSRFRLVLPASEPMRQDV